MNEKVTCDECKHFNARNNVCAVIENTVRPGYGCYEGEPRIITNGDKIRQMSDKELVKVLRYGFCSGQDMGVEGCPFDTTDCNECVEIWLKREAKDE